MCSSQEFSCFPFRFYLSFVKVDRQQGLLSEEISWLMNGNVSCCPQFLIFITFALRLDLRASHVYPKVIKLNTWEVTASTVD